MPRRPRVLEENCVYHVYNRRTDRQRLFPSPRAYDQFLLLMEESRERYGVLICAYVLMDTHWHQAVWIRDQDLRQPTINYLRRLSSCHALHFRSVSRTRGDGHVYQDRYKTKVAKDETHYLTLIRYIERNPLTAGLVDRAEQWPWSSCAERHSGRRRIVDDGPLQLPRNWIDIVNGREGHDEDQAMWGTEVEGGTEVRQGTEVRAVAKCL